MAGDWIKMRGNLWDDPRVARLCDLTDQTEAAIVGSLYWLWATADQHTEDGVMPGLTLRQIDRKTGVQGFGEALCAVGWLADHPEGVRLVKFDEHNGASAKKRCQTAKRVSCFKSGNAEVTQESAEGNAVSVTKPLAVRDLEIEIEIEKRREEKKEETREEIKTRAVALPSDVSPAVFSDWQALRKAKKAPITATAIDGIRREAEKAGITLESALAMACERGWTGFKADWLHDRGGGANGLSKQSSLEARNKAVADSFRGGI